MPTNQQTSDLRLVGVSGTNKIMAGEFSRIALRAGAPKLPEPKKDGLGSLVYPFSPAAAVLAARYHRTSSRVLWDIYQSSATRLEPLYADILRQVCDDNRGWLCRYSDAGMSISVDAHRVGEFAAGERQIVGTVKNAVVDGASRRGLSVAVNPDRPDVLLDVRLRDGVLTVSIDLAGRPMHLRGYRGDGGLAPMKENLAAALVMLCRHQSRTEPLLDPMAGSGTIAIEAAAMGLGCPVWVQPRVAACERMVSLMSASPPVAQPLFSDARPLVFANDNDPRSVDACRNHVRRAGMVPYVQCTSGDFQNIEYKTIIRTCESRGIGTTGVILTNPPYGERLSNPELHALYRDFGSWCRQFAGWRAGILVANPDFEEMFGGKARIRKPLSNGPIRSTFLLYDL